MHIHVCVCCFIYLLFLDFLTEFFFLFFALFQLTDFLQLFLFFFLIQQDSGLFFWRKRKMDRNWVKCTEPSITMKSRPPWAKQYIQIVALSFFFPLPIGCVVNCALLRSWIQILIDHNINRLDTGHEAGRRSTLLSWLERRGEG